MKANQRRKKVIGSASLTGGSRANKRRKLV
jgi:hypothetical protein